MEAPGTPAGEHAPTGARRVVRDTVRVRFVETATRRAGDRALRAVVEAVYQVEGDTVRVVVPTDAARPAEAWLDGRPLVGETGRVPVDSLRPFAVDPAERARIDSARVANGLSPTARYASGPPADILAFSGALEGGAQLRVAYPLSTTSRDVRDSPHADHDVVIDWAEGVVGDAVVTADAPAPWAASVIPTDQGVRVEARRPWSRANRALFDVWPWVVLGLALAASGWAGLRLGRVLGRRPQAPETTAKTQTVRVVAGLGLVGAAVAIGLAAGLLATLLVIAAAPQGDSYVFIGALRTAGLGVGVIAALGSVVVALIAGGIAWRRTARP